MKGGKNPFHISKKTYCALKMPETENEVRMKDLKEETGVLQQWHEENWKAQTLGKKR